MEEKKIYFVVGIPLVGAALLAGALYVRFAESEPAIQKRSASPKPAASNATGYSPAGEVYAPARREAAPLPAPSDKIAQATESVRIRGTYQNFRRAVASNDVGLQDQLLPALLKDRTAARKCAEEDLARSENDVDRAVAQKVLEALRR